MDVQLVQCSVFFLHKTQQCISKGSDVVTRLRTESATLCSDIPMFGHPYIPTPIMYLPDPNPSR